MKIQQKDTLKRLNLQCASIITKKKRDHNINKKKNKNRTCN